MYECAIDFWNCVQDEQKREAVNLIYTLLSGLGGIIVVVVGWLFFRKRKSDDPPGYNASGGSVINTGTARDITTGKGGE